MEGAAAATAAGTSGRSRPRFALLAGVGANVTGAVVVLLFARATVRSYEDTHRLIGGVFILQQVLVAVALLVRRLPRSASRRPLDWAAALGGSFGGFLLRPGGYQPASTIGVGLQVLGLAVWTFSFFALGRSFGLVAADRGVVTRGPYKVVRHPLYASYMVTTQLGYVLQSLSLWNVVVLAFSWSCQIARLAFEEHLLEGVGSYRDYRTRVRRRLFPGVW